MSHMKPTVKVASREAFFQKARRKRSRFGMGMVRTRTSVARFTMPKAAKKALWLPQEPPGMERSQL